VNATITVRPATLVDIDEMAATAVGAWREGFRGIVPEDIDPEPAWRPARLSERLRGDVEDGREMLVAEVDGKVRGLVLLGPSRDRDATVHDGEVIALYVHPDQWRRGIGRQLVEGALKRLRAAGFSESIVWTLAESPRNLAFYESLGFTRDGGTQRRPSFGNPLEVRFRRPLGADQRPA
jgi:ribosomal protein S18 acetylase RimI-like enzyme